MYGNGCAGSTASGVSTGKMRCSKNAISSQVLVRARASAQSTSCDAVIGAASAAGGRARSSPARRRSRRRRRRSRRAARRGVRPSGAGVAMPGRHLVLQRGDAHLEELVEVGRDDGAELQPLEQRDAGLLGQRQDAPVEREPAQLTVEQALQRRSAFCFGDAEVPLDARCARARRRGRCARGCGGTADRPWAAAPGGPAHGRGTRRAPCGRPSRRRPPSGGRPGRGTRCERGPAVRWSMSVMVDLLPVRLAQNVGETARGV